MNLYAFNAYRSGSDVGVLVGFEDNGRWKTPIDQARAENPDMRFFTPLPFVPVWAIDVWPHWYQWRCLRGDITYQLPAFHSRPDVMYRRDKIYDLSVPLLRNVVDPYSLSLWLWGVQVNEDDVAWCVTRPNLTKEYEFDDYLRHGDSSKRTHAVRIAKFVLAPSSVPILISTDYGMNNVGFAVEDGNHRLAAAIYARRSVIKATMVGSVYGIIERFLHSED